MVVLLVRLNYQISTGWGGGGGCGAGGAHTNGLKQPPLNRVEPDTSEPSFTISRISARQVPEEKRKKQPFIPAEGVVILLWLSTEGCTVIF